ncbi:hypothetical protein H7F51_07640 [Novosphingobium flavum]|uniref:Alpha/beta hydrolase n=1 Tax=Novosphingobium flavum TaxID=1778672 RepID=A0A7X1FR19_9SPHN|nr:hypothetical protein [Novosphingobium flavum]MBC2665389.1 hypothetical protein [Novosphingobium flavum]
MKLTVPALAALALIALPAALVAQAEAPTEAGLRARVGPLDGKDYSAGYVRLGRRGEGMVFQPLAGAAVSPVAVVFTHPGGDNFTAPIGRELARRGFRTINVNARIDPALGVDQQLPVLSAAVAYMRSLPGVTRVVIAGHSGGAHQMTLYENVAEHGPSACNGPEKVYPCQASGLEHLAKPDGLILLDPPLGDFHGASSIDPASAGGVNARVPALDMFAKANGYDASAGKASYSAAFAKRYYAAQAARNAALLARAQARIKAIEAGKGLYANDEPLTVPGLGEDAGGARLYQSDLTFLAHTKAPHTLVKADGSEVQTVIHTVRPAQFQAAKQVRELGTSSSNTTVRGFLAHDGIRLLPDYAITADDIVGVDWKSGYDSAPGNAYGITVPTLVLTMGCHYLVVPGEVIFDRLASKDKTYAAVEGATHEFTACKPQYGDSTKRTFDYVAGWLSKPGRF